MKQGLIIEFNKINYNLTNNEKLLDLTHDMGLWLARNIAECHIKWEYTPTEEQENTFELSLNIYNLFNDMLKKEIIESLRMHLRGIDRYLNNGGKQQNEMVNEWCDIFHNYIWQKRLKEDIK